MLNIFKKQNEMSIVGQGGKIIDGAAVASRLESLPGTSG
jgi:hypothetical protein